MIAVSSRPCLCTYHMTCCVCEFTAGDAVQCQFEQSGCTVDFEVDTSGFEASGFVFVGEERGQRTMYNFIRSRELRHLYKCVLAHVYIYTYLPLQFTLPEVLYTRNPV